MSFAESWFFRRRPSDGRARMESSLASLRGSPGPGRRHGAWTHSGLSLRHRGSDQASRVMTDLALISGAVLLAAAGGEAFLKSILGRREPPARAKDGGRHHTRCVRHLQPGAGRFFGRRTRRAAGDRPWRRAGQQCRERRAEALRVWHCCSGAAQTSRRDFGLGSRSRHRCSGSYLPHTRRPHRTR